MRGDANAKNKVITRENTINKFPLFLASRASSLFRSNLAQTHTRGVHTTARLIKSNNKKKIYIYKYSGNSTKYNNKKKKREPIRNFLKSRSRIVRVADDFN